MALVSVGVADVRVLHPLVKAQRWDRGGRQAAPPGKSCAVINIGTNILPFMEHSCHRCPAGSRDTQANNDNAADQGWEREVCIKHCGFTGAQSDLFIPSRQLEGIGLGVPSRTLLLSKGTEMEGLVEGGSLRQWHVSACG